jgi:cytochrome b6
MPSTVYILRRASTILAVTTLTLTLMAALTGILIAFYYEPTAGGAYQSLKTLTTTVSNGWLIRTIHNLAGNLLIVVGLVQIVAMFLSERFRSSWLSAWISGILLVLVAIALDWTAIILDWSQLGFWRFRIELGTIEAIPLVGSYLREILVGGDTISTVTVTHLYTLHSYVLAIAAVVLAVIHLASLLFQEREISRQDNTTLPEANPKPPSDAGSLA